MSSPDKINDALRTAADKSTATSEAVSQQDEATKASAVKADNVSSSASDTSAVGTSRETQSKDVKANLFASYESDSSAAQALIASWQDYESKAAPTVRQTPASLKAIQTTLVNLITQTVNLKEDLDFITVSQRLLTMMAENKKGTFKISTLYRSLVVAGTSDRAVNNVRFTLDCYLTFADVKNRSNAIRAYNLEQSAALANSVAARDRFVAYFTRISGGN